jgi:hypothetical protein
VSDDQKGFEGWAILELMGHRRLVGRLSEATIAGAAFVRIDVADADGNETTQFYSPAAVYALTPTTEEIARRAARTNSVQPISAWELRDRQPVKLAAPADEDDEDTGGERYGAFGEPREDEF